MKKMRKLLLLVLALAMVVCSAGCGKQEEVVVEGNGEIPETLSIYGAINSYALKAGAQDNNDTLYFQEMERLTGCHVEWVHPTAGASGEKFNLLIASGNLPDMMVAGWKNIQGGAKMYVEDEVIIPLKDLIKENMPNLTAYLEANPDVAKQFTDDDGEIYYIPFIRQDEELKIFQGPQIRQDWLEKLGLEVPKTPEELYEVLKAFKTQDPNGNGVADEIPMSGVKFEDTSQAIGNLLWAFGTTFGTANGFYQKDGKITYGVLEPEFEEGVAYITKLFSEGLIDQDYLLNDRDKMDNKFMNDKVGFVYSLQPGNYYKNMNDNGRKVVGIPHLAKEGVVNNVFDNSYLDDVVATSIAVTTACKNPAGALKWLDHFFGGEGQMIMNYGKEGLSYEMVDGYPKLTDYIFNNPDGKSQQEISGLALGAYQSSFPTLQQWTYYEQILSPWGKESIENWSKGAGTDGLIPSGLSFTDEERDVVTQNMSQISTFVSEKVNKIVVGNADISELANVRESIKKMGIEEVIKIYSTALDRYNKR